MAWVLILDDDSGIQQLLEELIDDLGHRHRTAASLADGLSMAGNQDFDLVLLDLDFPEGNGLEIMPDLFRLPSAPEIMIITGTGDAEAAELAFKYGAWDYVRKPFLIETVSFQVTRALQYHAEKAGRTKPAILKRDRIVGDSDEIRFCLDEVAKPRRQIAAFSFPGKPAPAKSSLPARSTKTAGVRMRGLWSLTAVHCRRHWSKAFCLVMRRALLPVPTAAGRG